MTYGELLKLNDTAKTYLSKLDDTFTSRELVIENGCIYVKDHYGILTLVNMRVLVNRLKQCHYYIGNPEKFKELQYDNKD